MLNSRLRVVEVLQDGDHLSTLDVCRLTGLAIHTVHRALRELSELGSVCICGYDGPRPLFSCRMDEAIQRPKRGPVTAPTRPSTAGQVAKALKQRTPLESAWFACASACRGEAG